MSDNIPGKPRVSTMFLGGFPLYVEHCEKAVRTRAGFVSPSRPRSGAQDSRPLPART